MSAKVLAKLSAKNCGINVQLEIVKHPETKKEVPLAKENEHNAFLFRATGIATGFKTGIATYGEWIAFIGNFEIVKVETGEIFRGGKLFLPPIASNLLQGAMGNGPVEFGFDIGVTPAIKSSVGYEWSATPIMEVAENDPIKLMQAKLKNAPAIPAPTKNADGSEVEKKDSTDTGNEPANVTKGAAKGKK